MLNNNLNLMPLNFNIITQGTSGLSVLLANAQSNGIVIWKINPMPSQNTFLIDQNETIVINCKLSNDETNNFLLKKRSSFTVQKRSSLTAQKRSSLTASCSRIRTLGLTQISGLRNGRII